jgi:hypothetical protein
VLFNSYSGVVVFFFGIIFFIAFCLHSIFLIFCLILCKWGWGLFHFLNIFLVHLVFLVFFSLFTFLLFLFHGISQCMLCFLSSIVEDEPHSTSTILGRLL